LATVKRQAGARSGFSVIELLIALALMAFLSGTLFAIIVSGGDAFQRVLDEKSAQGEARIAISYITVRLRQNSSRAMVSVVPSDSLTNVRNVLMIDGGGGAGRRYIYFEENENGGRLVEKTSATPKVDDPEGAVRIADISDFSISYLDENQTVINISVYCESPGEWISREVSVALRSS